ncbi:ammonia-dependent NAD(+) synthetase [Melghirimyces algeriensis]|uniref:NH(3)-dependent NAD(+) synthetase n=1 Tax=Melghirimyces algeriensis TaxID=910412 RepID=A0A521EZ37_9BACL|nr:ammonia-dependent NAD(+) synthetase [Melghirimyces algeriensis]SMO89169.1 NH(3)-dependent NAD(+) synthetase [Melghirimyces algeriensis]
MRPIQQRIIDELHVQPTIDLEKEIQKRVQFIKQYILSTGTQGLVLGISGGQDSTLAGKLCQMAVEELRKETQQNYQFIAMRLPYGVQRDEEDARQSLQFIQPDRTLTFNIKEAVDGSVRGFKEATGQEISDYVKGNAKARERMVAQYEIAGTYNLLVVGTDHAAEAVTGFFTKYGDGGCDLIPLFGLNKRQGKQLLKYLGAEPSLYEKTPTADLLDDQPGRSDEDELQLTYNQIDNYLEGKEVPLSVAKRIEQKFLSTRHKRALPVTPFDDWWKT